MKKRILCWTFVIACLQASPLLAQYTLFTPEGSFAIEVSLPNSELVRLPIYRNSISSLEVLGDYIVGGTSAREGLSPFVFAASLKERKLLHVKDLEEVAGGQQCISSGFARGKDNTLYAGTLAGKDAPGGHLIGVTLGPDGAVNIRDLGVPVAGEGVFSLLCNSRGTTLYGITYPSGLFFQYDIATGKTKTYDDIAADEKARRVAREYSISPENYLGKALVEDNQGLIYGSMPVNKLFYFDPSDESFHVLDQELPEVWGRRTLGQVEAWAKAPDGKLYGGNAGDGQLFELDPATKIIRNLGKPIMMNRLRGLTFGKDGKLYGIAGALPGYAHLFSYDPDGKGYVDMGNPEFEMKAPGIEQGILWRGFQLGTITSSEDKRYIVMGEDEDLSQLLIFPVE